MSCSQCSSSSTDLAPGTRQCGPRSADAASHLHACHRFFKGRDDLMAAQLEAQKVLILPCKCTALGLVASLKWSPVISQGDTWPAVHWHTSALAHICICVELCVHCCTHFTGVVADVLRIKHTHSQPCMPHVLLLPGCLCLQQSGSCPCVGATQSHLPNQPAGYRLVTAPRRCPHGGP